MNKVKLFIFVGIAMLFVGCPARSIFPLFTDKELVFNPAFVGTWNSMNKKETYSFQKWDEKMYRLVWSEENGDSAVYRVRIGQIGEFLFLDSYPENKQPDYHVISTHVISKVWIEGDTIRVASLEGDWLKKMTDNNEITIPHIDRGDDVILTASTEELQQFIHRYGGESNAFPNQDILIRGK
jgi:hypothetical protein